MALFNFFKKSTPPAPQPPAVDPVGGHQVRKGAPTPTRREAEAARMARLHPELDPKKAKELNREAQAEARRTQLRAVDNLPERALMRDVVDARFNIGEIALPLMLAVLLMVMIPQLTSLATWTVYGMWFVILLIIVDLFIVWRRFKKLAAQRIPDRPLRGMMFYGWNRQMSFRRWRMPAPRVTRGQDV